MQVASKISKHHGRKVDFRTHVLIVARALDYEGYPAEKKFSCAPLSCTSDAVRLQELASKCGCKDVHLMSGLGSNRNTSDWPTKANVVAQFEAMGQRCAQGGTFRLFFSGHGEQSKSADSAAAEVDGENVEMCHCIERRWHVRPVLGLRLP